MSDRGYRRGHQGGGYNQQYRQGGGYNRNRHSGGYRGCGNEEYHDRRQQHGSAHQRSFVGQKRGREHVEHDPKIQLVKQLLRLGEPGEEGNDRARTPADTVLAASQAFGAAINSTGSDHRQLQQLLLDAVCGCPHKTALYAHLAGLLNVDHSDWVGQLVQLVVQQLAGGLAGPAASPAPRLLLRFLACLPAVGVITHASLAQLLQRILEAATAGAHSGAAVDPSGALWQPWADFLAYAALSALPWCGADLVVAAGGELQQVLAAAEVYMGQRPQQEDPLLRPYYGAGSAADAADAGDSGGASFLPLLLHMLQTCQEEEAWQVRCLERHYLVHEQQLARNIPTDLPVVELPTAPPAAAVPTAPGDPVSAAAAAASVRAAYPPRGGLTLFDRALLSHKEGQEPTDTELFVGTEWIIDLLTTYDGHRAQLAQVLATGLPPIGAQGALLAQVLLGQLLRLPASPLPTCAYVTLIVDLCKLMPVFAKYYAGGVRRLFERCDYLDPQLRALLATALAHHVSNFSWLWPWDRFKGVLSQEPAAAQRGWVMLAMSHMVRLSDYDTMRKVLEENHMQDYVPLLGEVPVVHLMPAPQPYPPGPGMTDAAAAGGGAAEATAAGPAANGQAAAAPALAGQPSDVPMADVSQAGDAPEAMDTSGDAAQPAAASGLAPATGNGAGPPPGEQPRVDEPSGEDPEALWAGRLLATLTSRKPAPGGPAPSGRTWGKEPAPPPSVPVTYEDVVAWMEASQMRAQLGEPLPLLRAVVRALLSAAAKSLTHIHVLLERYAPLLREVVEAAGHEQGVVALLQLVGAMYVDFPSRLHTALEKLVLLGVVTVPRAVSWCVREWPAFVLGPSSQPVAAALAWEVLDVTLGDAAARAEEAAGAVQQADAVLEQEQARLAEATAAVEEVAAQVAAAAAAAENPEEGGEGEQPSAAPLSRQMELAQQQQKAAGKVEDAQQAKADAQQTLAELQQSLIGGLQEALSGLAQRLSQLEELEEAGRQLGWAQVRGFMRGQARRFLTLLGPQLHQLAAELAPGPARDALLGPLGMPGGAEGQA